MRRSLNEKKLDLLQHPLCLAILLQKWSLYCGYYYFTLGFYLASLILLNLYEFSSPSEIYNKELFACNTAWFWNVPAANPNQPIGSKPIEPPIYGINSDWNTACRWILITLIMARVLIFFIVQEHKSILNNLKEIPWSTVLKNIIRRKNLWSSFKSLPLLFLLDFIVFSLAFYIAIHNFSMVSRDGSSFFRTDVRSCVQWQIAGITLTLAWLNLLIHMRSSLFLENTSVSSKI